MAARIPLILSQPSRRDAAAIDLIENIVAAAMLVSGLDANLIGDISTFELGGTDHLCLQGHTRDVVLASFLDLATAREAWHRLGQSGHFVDFTSTEAQIRSSLGDGSTGRRVFYFQLASQRSVTELLDQCQKLLAAQQLSLVSIRIGTAGPTGSPPTTLPITSNLSRNSQQPSGAPPLIGKPSLATAISDAALKGSDRHDDDEDWSRLDKLVDDLDAMDL